MKNKLLLFILIVLSIPLALATPLVTFNSPTSSATSTANNFIEINASIVDANLGSLTYNWNGTNYTFFNSSVKLLYNFENIASLGENITYIVDMSGNNHACTISGGQGDEFTANGKFGQALDFYGVESATIPHHSDLTPPLHFSFWFKTRNAGGGGTFFSKYGGPSYGWDGWSLNIGADNKTYVWLNGNTQDNYWNSGSNVVTNNLWHFMYVDIVRGGTVKVYLDGALILSQTDGNTAYSEAVPLAFAPNFNGTIDEVMFFNYALSTAQINQLYFTQIMKYNSNTWGLYVNQSQNITTGLSNGTYTYQVSATNSSGSLNSSDLRTVTIGVNTPIITLSSPANSASSISSTQYFVASFTTGANLVNSTLYIWNSSSSIINTTYYSISGTSNSTNISITLPYNDAFKWNYYVCDNSSACVFASSNFTFTYDTTAPMINVVYPTNTTYALSLAGLNYTYSDISSGSCWYSTNSGTTNSSSVTAGTNFTGLDSTAGSNTWSIYCNDSSGNLASDSITFSEKLPQIGLTLLAPTTDVNVTQNQFFEVRARVSCSNNDCGEINVTLDPSSNTQYNFTNCGASGTSGPSQSNCNTNYSGTSLEGLVNVSGGIQNWTVPATGTYTIEVWGAQGGALGAIAGGFGARMKGTFSLTEGQVLQILVGQAGGYYASSYGGGGGGGTFVANGTSYLTDTPIIIAGGGGGAGTVTPNNANASTDTSGLNGGNTNPGTGGTNGNGASGGSYGGDGGGFLTSGTGGQSSSRGSGFRQGGAGSTGAAGGTGGFGGAGGGYGGAGGAGGYSGGGGGGWSNGGWGGGGGSYNNGTNQNNSVGTRTGDGLVSITFVGAGKGGTVSTVSGTTPFYTNVTNPYNLTLNNGDSQTISWWVNATGTLNGNYTFFVYANQTSNPSIGAMTSNWTVTIVNFTVDNTAPSVALASPANGVGNNGNLTFNYNVTDANNVSSCSLIFNGATNQTNYSIAQNIAQNFTLNNLDVGGYSWNVNCTDNFNNIGSGSTRTFAVVKKSGFPGATSDLTQLNVSNITNFIIDSLTYGMINFLEEVNLSSGADIDSYVIISQNRIEINSTALNALNKSAKLKLYNLTFNTPQILKDGELCPSTSCTEESYVDGTYTFNVTGFSVYSARETPASNPSSSSSSGGSGGGGSGGIVIKKECEIDSECKQGYSCFKNKCVKLFDVEILDVPSLVTNSSFELSYLVKGMADIKGDVIIKFWIENNGEKINLGKDTIYFGSFEEKTKTTTINLPRKVLDGDYDLYVQAGFENYEAESFRKISIALTEEERVNLSPTIGDEIVGTVKIGAYVMIAFFALILAYLLAYLVIKRREVNYSNLIEEYKKQIMYLDMIKKDIIRHASEMNLVEINSDRCYPSNNLNSKVDIGYENLEKSESENNYDEYIGMFRLLTSLHGKIVYSEEGDEIGTIDEPVLEGKKVYGWIVTPLDKYQFGENILIKHSDVINLGEVMIVKEGIEEYLINAEKIDFSWNGVRKIINKIKEFIINLKLTSVKSIGH